MNAKETKTSGLTKRQLEVLSHLAQGKADSEIAADLGLATVTIKHHLKTGRKTLEARSRLHYVIKAIQLGIIKV